MKKGIKLGLAALLVACAGTCFGISAKGKKKSKLIFKQEKKTNKFKSYYSVLNQWLVLKQEGKSLEEYFHDNNINHIAIYGMGEMGNRLYDELKNSDIKIDYAIDKNADSIYYADLKIIDSEDVLPKVDAIIVTAIFDFEDIERKLSEVTDCQIISLEDVVFEI